MARVVIISWDRPGTEQRARQLRKSHDVEIMLPRGMPELRALGDAPPDAVVLDLERRPSEGRSAAIAIRQRKATRHVPLVFAGGEPDKVARVRELLPDATYTDWKRVRGALRGALRRPLQAKPVVRATMDAYSGTPLPKKLGVRESTTLAFVGSRGGFGFELPPGARAVRGPANVVLLFVRNRGELERRFDSAVARLDEPGRLWIAWPKRASGLQTDLGEAAVRAHGMGHGLVDYKVASLDATWSGLCFARRS